MFIILSVRYIECLLITEFVKTEFHNILEKIGVVTLMKVFTICYLKKSNKILFMLFRVHYKIPYMTSFESYIFDHIKRMITLIVMFQSTVNGP